MRKIIIIIFFIPIITNAQCAMCKAVVENGNETMAEGINSGITYLMIFPYLLVGILIYVLYMYRKTAKN